MSRPTILYVLLAYGLSWCAFTPLALQGQGIISGVPAWLHLLGAYGPLAAAFIVTLLTAGPAGARELVARMARWQIGWGWLLVAALSPVAVFGLVVSVLRLIDGTWQAASGFGRVAELPQLGWLAGWAVWILTFGIGEETGWRGFAIPRLQARYSARDAALIVGLLWA
ncbi:MAG: CPBP family intramembrane metalloprotease, partial [Chloroflexus sp.]|nr:CPBP family intramembrane metalloprotease [Chloroflexus sp.]